MICTLLGAVMGLTWLIVAGVWYAPLFLGAIGFVCDYAVRSDQ